VVGAVVLLPHGHELGSITRGRDEEQINLLAVDAPARRRGVGRALLEECARRARARGHRALVLWTRPTHHEAPPLYESLGYARVPDRDSAPDGHPRVAYRLEL
jgi:ribosomal protein S18 acetylase RimI-like enzyme